MEGGGGWNHEQQLGSRRVKGGGGGEAVLRSTDTQQVKGMAWVTLHLGSGARVGGECPPVPGKGKVRDGSSAAHTGGTSPGLRPVHVGITMGKPACVSQLSFPPLCLDHRWALCEEDALLLEQMV